MPPGLPYSAAKIVAHMNSNMMFNLGPLRADDPLTYTVGYKLALSVAKHNAYHLGQIVVIRRLLGFWEE